MFIHKFQFVASDHVSNAPHPLAIISHSLVCVFGTEFLQLTSTFHGTNALLHLPAEY